MKARERKNESRGKDMIEKAVKKSALNTKTLQFLETKKRKRASEEMKRQLSAKQEQRRRV